MNRCWKFVAYNLIHFRGVISNVIHFSSLVVCERALCPLCLQTNLTLIDAIKNLSVWCYVFIYDCAAVWLRVCVARAIKAMEFSVHHKIIAECFWVNSFRYDDGTIPCLVIFTLNPINVFVDVAVWKIQVSNKKKQQ